jgi:hypothetical protein
MAQGLHPEKFLADEPVEPTLFSGGEPTAALGEGWTLVLENTLGEFDLRIHFTDALGADAAAVAAAGWDGIRYWFCRNEGTAPFVGLASTWETEADAGEFAAAWARWAAARDGAATEVRAIFSGLVPAGYDIATKEGAVHVRFEGCDVWIADGCPAGRADAVFAAMRAAERTVRKADARPRALR